MRFKMAKLIGFLVDCRKDLGLFKVEKAALECDVTTVTVRNFENGSHTNAFVLMYYINEVKKFFTEHAAIEKWSYVVSHGTWDEEDLTEFTNYYNMETLEQLLDFTKGE